MTVPRGSPEVGRTRCGIEERHVNMRMGVGDLIDNTVIWPERGGQLESR